MRPMRSFAGTSLALITAAIYLLFAFHRYYMETPLWTVLRGIYIRPILAGILASFSLIGFHYLVPGIASLSEVRYLIPIKLAADFAIFVPAYIVFLVALRQVSIIDWNNFQWFVAFGFEFLRYPLRERVKVYR